MPNPKVSIVMPVYNVAHYLEECMESVIHQSLNEIEIICIDDGSTDGSSEILDRYVKSDGRVKVVHNSNHGYGKSMNIGFSMACGEYIGVVETDDYIAPEMMEELYYSGKYHNVDVIKGDYYIFKEEGGKRKFQYTKLIDNTSIYNKILNPILDKEIFNARINTWAGIYKREFIENNGIIHNETPGASYQDNGFWFQVFTQAKRVILLPKPYYYLRRDNPNSSINSKEKVYCVCDEMKFIRDYMLKKPFIYENFGAIFWQACIKKYIFNLKRISSQYKLEFLCSVQKEFCAMGDDIDTSLFSETQKKYFDSIIENPEEFWKEYVDLPEDIIHFGNENNTFILFGHGKNIYRVYKKCRFHNLNVFMLANLKEDNDTHDREIPVVNIEEVKSHARNIAVLIIDKRKNKEKMCSKLNELGFSKYLFYEGE